MLTFVCNYSKNVLLNYQIMATIKVVLFKHNTSMEGKHPVYLRVTQDRKSRYIKIGTACKPELWDEKTNMPKRTHPDYFEMKVLIEKKISEAGKMLLHDEIDDKERSVEELQKRFKKGKMNKISVLKYFEQIIKQLKGTGRLGYAAVFTSTMNSLSTFRDSKDFEFSDITLAFITRYEESFLKRGVKPNSVFVLMRTFKTLINYAKKDEVVRDTFDPFKEFSFRKYRSIKTKKRAISKEDIIKIGAYETIPGSSIDHAKKYFMFSYYTRGTNFSDMCYVKWENISNNRLEYIRKKTKKQLSIGLLEPAVEILNYFKDKYYDGEDGYIFPILKRHHVKPETRENRIDKVLRAVNDDLKIIAEKCEINEVLTTYVARHSYATVMKKSGALTSHISESMGHQNERTTQIYLDSFENTVLDEANKAILLDTPVKKAKSKKKAPVKKMNI